MPESDNVLGRAAECQACGRTMVHINKAAADGGWLVCGSTLRGVGCEEPARWRFTRAEAAVLNGGRRMVVRLRFTPFAILADFGVDSRTSKLAWNKGVALNQLDEDRHHWAEQAESETTSALPGSGPKRQLPPAKSAAR